ncbi:50S ribosomal protein L9 [Hyphobacterium sp. CCMP332]|nr:50S ribosomal protein L9 [Hyphobacterium sp. CCMP332]
MEIILKEDIQGLGYKNDLIDVKPGYGRNFLIPQGKAIIASESNKKVLEENLKQAAHKIEKVRKEAEALSDKIGDDVVTLKAKVGEKGKIFGAITTLQVADALKEKGIDIDRKKIQFNEDIKFVGDYTAVIDLHKEIKHNLKISVIAED